MSEMFQSVPESGERFKLREWVGHLCLFTPHRFREDVPMPNGATDVIEGDVVVLTAQPVQTYPNTWVLGKYVVPRLREAIGGVPVLARVEIVPGSEKRDRPAHQLGPFTPQDAQFAEQYIRSQPTVQASPQQVYAPPGVTTNVVPAPTAYTESSAPSYGQAPVVSVPTPAPQPPAPAPAQATPPVPVTPAGPVAQAGAQAPASSVPEMDDEQFAGMPEDVQKLLDAARYARLHGGQS